MPAETIKIRIFVEGGVAHSVCLHNPNSGLDLAVDVEIFDGDGDFADEYETAWEDTSNSNDWQAIA